jgi:outer membrane protein OmpA-like peptidoglycan-associated protein
MDGHRVTVPALHLRGAFSDGARTDDLDLWVLADSAHPLLLKGSVGDAVFQVTRVDVPSGTTTGDKAPGGGGMLGGGVRLGGMPVIERQLVEACRVELSGVYFAFNSALINPASDQALAQLAAVLARHADWSLALEGHTDSVGTAAANQTLSERRAEAERSRLAERHGVDTRAWTAAGYGASRPREPNSTIEGRARNRRVELVRACPERG